MLKKISCQEDIPKKEKKLSNMRAAGKDDNDILATVKQMTLEQEIAFIRENELVEITSLSVRMRKIVLSAWNCNLLRPKSVD